MVVKRIIFVSVISNVAPDGRLILKPWELRPIDRWVWPGESPRRKQNRREEKIGIMEG
jgi:hypothetical protein